MNGRNFFDSLNNVSDDLLEESEAPYHHTAGSRIPTITGVVVAIILVVTVGIVALRLGDNIIRKNSDSYATDSVNSYTGEYAQQEYEEDAFAKVAGASMLKYEYNEIIYYARCYAKELPNDVVLIDSCTLRVEGLGERPANIWMAESTPDRLYWEWLDEENKLIIMYPEGEECFED